MTTLKHIKFERICKMSSLKLVLTLPDRSRIWINPAHIVKMVKTATDHYYLYLITGETYEVDHRTASAVEGYLED